MKKPRRPSTNGITPEERAIEIQDMLLKRAEEVKREREETLARIREAKAKALAAGLKRPYYLKRCRECKAMKFYLKSGGPKSENVAPLRR